MKRTERSSLKIGELAKHAGLTVRTLHHYDQIGLLSPSARSEGGFRLYNQDDVVRLHRIQALKKFGCSLPEIAAFLAQPGASITEILSQQMSVLQEQALRAQALHDRLARLRDQVSRGESAGLPDWLALLDMMTRYEKHLSKQEIDTLLARKSAGNLDLECSRLVSLLRSAMERGVPPESEEAQQLAWSWMRFWREATGNDAALALRLRRIHRDELVPPLFDGITPEIKDYLIPSFASAKIAILARYLSPEELEAVRVRLKANFFNWPPLVAEIQQQMNLGAAPEDPAVQSLARRWLAQFRDSYHGGDPVLEQKIRSAAESEPSLLTGIGIDERLLCFVHTAVDHLNCLPRETGETPPRSRKSRANRAEASI